MIFIIIILFIHAYHTYIIYKSEVFESALHIAKLWICFLESTTDNSAQIHLTSWNAPEFTADTESI